MTPVPLLYKKCLTPLGFLVLCNVTFPTLPLPTIFLAVTLNVALPDDMADLYSIVTVSPFFRESNSLVLTASSSSTSSFFAA